MLAILEWIFCIFKNFYLKGCALDLSSKRCTHEDLKILEEGFYGIQEILESKDCSDNPRSSVKCDELWVITIKPYH
jgi:hypothetical protein